MSAVKSMIEMRIKLSKLANKTRLFSTSSAALTLSLLVSVTPAFAQAPDFDEEIIITGARILEGDVDDAITGISVLEGDRLEDRLASTIGETLKGEPGVSSTFFGAGASRPIIRGQGGDRVRVLTNGIGSIDASSASPDHAVAAEPAQAEKIEVLRGASILRFGSSGAGGVVNVIDGRIPQQMPDGAEAAVRFSAASVDSSAELAASVEHGLGSNIAVHLDGTWREASDYRIPGYAESEIFHEAEEEEEEHEGEHEEEHEDEEREGEAFGRLENSFVQSSSLTGGLSYIGERGFLGVAVHHFDSQYGIPGGHGHGHEDDHEGEHEGEEEHEEEEEEEGEESVSIDLKQTRFDLNASYDLGGFFERVQWVGGYADYEHTELEGDEIGTVFANEGWESRVEFIQAEKNGWEAAYGIQLRNRDFSAIGAEAFVPPAKTNQVGVYTFQEMQIEDLHLEGAVRAEFTEQKNQTDNITRNFELLSVSGGADYHISDAIRIGGTVFRTERAPTSEELFSNGPHLATEAFEVGNPDLGKETATGAEMAFRHRGANSFLTTNLFYTDYGDYIFERPTGAEEDELDVFEFIADDAEFYGFEVQGGYELGYVGKAFISVDGLVEYVRAKTDTDNLPRIPPLSVLVGGDVELNNLNLRGELEYADAQDNFSANELPTEDYLLTNAYLTWKFPGENSVKFKLSALNLFNEDARQHTSFLKDLVPLPGRNVRFSVLANF